MQIESIRNQNIAKSKDNLINKTLKGVLVNNHVKNTDKYSFDEIQDSLLVCEQPDTASTKQITSLKKEKEEDFDVKKAMKPLIIGTLVLAGGSFLLSSILKKSSQKLITSKSFEQLPDLAVNMNIKEEPHFAIYRAIRDPNFKNIMGAAAVFIMSGITIAGKNFVDGAKEIWIKKQSADIEKNLQENLIKVETDSFSGKLQFVNQMLKKNIKYFDEVINSSTPQQMTNASSEAGYVAIKAQPLKKSKEIFSGFPSFKSNQKNETENKTNTCNKNLKYALLILGVTTGALILGKFSINNIKKALKYTQQYANKYTEKTIETINNTVDKGNKQDISVIVELLKSICAKPEYIEEIGTKYGLTNEEILKIVQSVNKSKKTIFADAPTALGGIPKKIQYYCYLDENRGHLYNWILNPDNKFTKYIFMAFTIASAAGYIFKQGLDAIKDVTVLKENAKTELNLRKRLVDVEVENFKSKKQSAITPLVDNFTKQTSSKSKDELKQLADNILTEIKNGPPYVYT